MRFTALHSEEHGMARVGIREVAALAEVAVGTVSHFLNHPDKVSPEKAQRISSAIETLGFVRNNAGRQLRLGASSAIAYIAPDVSNPVFSEIAENVERRASDRGFEVFIANSHRSIDRENAYLAQFEQYGVRGMLVSSHEPIEDRLARVRSRGTPSVLVGQAAVSTTQPSISVDDIEGGRIATQHLLDAGRRRLCFIGGPLGVKQIGDRLEGASDAVRSSGQATLEVINVTDRTIQGGRDAGHQLTSRPADMRPDGIFAANDLLALGLMQVLSLAGITIPGDISLIGYDDIPFGEIALVPLSTVRASRGDFGTDAVDLLFDAIAGGEGFDKHLLFKPDLVVRASSIPGSEWRP
jgi:LacI family transcriptional regulator